MRQAPQLCFHPDQRVSELHHALVGGGKLAGDLIDADVDRCKELTGFVVQRVRNASGLLLE